MARKLTKKQQGFIKDYLETGNGTQSALKNYDTNDYATANAIAVENLQKPSVREYLESKAERAAEIIVELAETAQQENVRLGASKDIMDRAGYKPIDKALTLSVSKKVDSAELQKLANELLRIQREDTGGA